MRLYYYVILAGLLVGGWLSRPTTAQPTPAQAAFPEETWDCPDDLGPWPGGVTCAAYADLGLAQANQPPVPMCWEPPSCYQTHKQAAFLVWETEVWNAFYARCVGRNANIVIYNSCKNQACTDYLACIAAGTNQLTCEENAVGAIRACAATKSGADDAVDLQWGTEWAEANAKYVATVTNCCQNH